MKRLIAAAGVAATAFSLAACAENESGQDATSLEEMETESIEAQDPLGKEAAKEDVPAEAMVGQEVPDDDGAMAPIEGEVPLTPPEEQPQDGQ